MFRIYTVFCIFAMLFIYATRPARKSLPMYSSHRCIGDHESCELLNVCYFKERFFYFTSPNGYHHFGHKFNNDTGEYGSRDEYLPFHFAQIANNKAKDWLLTDHRQFPIFEKKQNIPKDAVWHDASLALPVIRVLANNFGHSMAEMTLPLFMLMSHFEEAFDPLFIFLDQCWNLKDRHVVFPHTSLERQLCENITRDQVSLLTSRPPLELNVTDGLLCFKRLLVGSTRFNALGGEGATEGRAGYFRLFRTAVLNRFHIWGKRKKDFRIIISKKASGNRSFNSRDIANPEEIAQGLLRMDFGVPINVHVVTLSEIPIADQVRIVSETAIWISPGGATLFLSPLLSDSSTLIVLPLCTPVHPRLSQNPRTTVCRRGFCCYSSEIPWYNQLPHRWEFYDVSVPDDIVGNCTFPHALMHERVHDCHVWVNLDRLEKIVRRAIFYRQQR